jgi:alanyl-tRNA synthetase
MHNVRNNYIVEDIKKCDITIILKCMKGESRYTKTINLYYADSHRMDFDGEVIAVFNNVLKQNKRNLIILNQSCFYPTSGGQQHDTGKMTI